MTSSVTLDDFLRLKGAQLPHDFSYAVGGLRLSRRGTLVNEQPPAATITRANIQSFWDDFDLGPIAGDFRGEHVDSSRLVALTYNAMIARDWMLFEKLHSDLFNRDEPLSSLPWVETQLALGGKLAEKDLADFVKLYADDFDRIKLLLPESEPYCLTLLEKITGSKNLASQHWYFRDQLTQAGLLVTASTYLFRARRTEPECTFASLFSDLASRRTRQLGRAIESGRNKFLYFLLDSGNVKSRVYSNSGIQRAQELGVQTQAFVNLTSSPDVYEATQTVIAHPRYRQAFSTLVQESLGLSLSDLDAATVRLFSDELASILLSNRFAPLSDISRLRERMRADFSWDKHISFRYATRTAEDLTLGDRCGDCTQESGANEHYAIGWLADPCTQILRLYYDGKFVARMNLVLVRSLSLSEYSLQEYGGEFGDHALTGPALLVDALEYTPQARKRDDLRAQADHALCAGLHKTRQLALSMGVDVLCINNSSNENVAEELVDSFSPPMHSLSQLVPFQLHGFEEALGYAAPISVHYQIVGDNSVDDFRDLVHYVSLSDVSE